MIEENIQTSERSTSAHLKQQVRDAARDTKEKTMRAAATLKDRYMNAALDCKEGIASRTRRIGDVLHGAAEELRREGDPNVADGIDAAARRVEDLSEYLHQADFATLKRGTADFTRRHPEWVYGGMFFAGLAIARLLKAGAPERMESESEWEPSEAYEAPYSEASETSEMPRASGPAGAPAQSYNPTLYPPSYTTSSTPQNPPGTPGPVSTSTEGPVL
jgi:hypothetical protein